MTLTDFKNWLKTQVNSPSMTTGKLDKSRAQTLCVYAGSAAPAIINVGGGASGYVQRNIKILVRWGNNSKTAEAKATEIYNLISNVRFKVSGKNVFVMPRNSWPVSLGTDEKGIYEYAIEIQTTTER